jgi:hypothetical protein
MSAGPVVGPGQRPNTVSPSTTNVGIPEIDVALQKKIGLKPMTTLAVNTNLIDILTPRELASLGSLLKKMGVPVRASNESIRNIFATDQVFIALANGKTSFPQLYQAIANDYNPILDSSKKEKEYLPTRSLTDVTDEQIGKIIDNASIATIGRVLPKKQRDAEIAKNRKLANQGTLTTTEKTKDPKTGKPMLVTKSKTPFTAEKVTLQLDESLKTSNPKQYQLNQSLKFQDELTKVLSGGI